MSWYTHEKFGFVHTSGIEMQWNNMKKQIKALRYASNEKVINEYVNMYTFRTLFKKTSLRDILLKCFVILKSFFAQTY